ncbi:MAG: rhodanese-like domain-containing protein [Ahniella sp.]|nr:rhodanese-like domain-containing protein [Ahniella sp.]
MLSQITLEDLHSGVQVVDVRLPEEFAAGHVPEAINLPLAHLREQAVVLDAHRAVAVYCDTGARSASATYLLCERGFDARLVAGGVSGELLKSN